MGRLHLGSHRQALFEQRLFLGQVVLGVLQRQPARLLPDAVDVLLALDAGDTVAVRDAGALDRLLASRVFDVEKISTNLDENVGAARGTQATGRGHERLDGAARNRLHGNRHDEIDDAFRRRLLATDGRQHEQNQQ